VESSTPFRSASRSRARARFTRGSSLKGTAGMSWIERRPLRAPTREHWPSPDVHSVQEARPAQPHQRNAPITVAHGACEPQLRVARSVERAPQSRPPSSCAAQAPQERWLPSRRACVGSGESRFPAWLDSCAEPRLGDRARKVALPRSDGFTFCSCTALRAAMSASRSATVLRVA